MSHLMGNDVCLREIPGRAEAPAQFVEERQIEINLVVVGTVERSDGGRAHSAGRSYGAAEQDEAGLPILVSQFRQHSFPGVLGIREDHGRKSAQLVLRWAA